MKSSARIVIFTISGIILLVGITAGLMIGIPKYNVWQQEMVAKSEFAKAEQNCRIKIEEAKANLEAEKLNAQAEIERAKGAAEAIKIENGQLATACVRHLWARRQNGNGIEKIICIPTEASMPILEAKNSQTRVKSEN